MVLLGEEKEGLPEDIQCWTPTDDHPEPTRRQIPDDDRVVNVITSSDRGESPNEFIGVGRGPFELVVSTLSHRTMLSVGRNCGGSRITVLLTLKTNVDFSALQVTLSLVPRWHSARELRGTQLCSQKNPKTPGRDSGGACEPTRFRKPDS